MKVLESFGQSEYLELAWQVRREVFIEEQDVPEEIERDDMDEKSWHILILDTEPVATGRLFEIEDGLYCIGRLAVLQKRRGRGLGHKLMQILLSKAWSLGAKSVELHAQVQAKAFYEAIGFIDQGQVFMEAGIEHITMIKNNPNL